MPELHVDGLTFSFPDDGTWHVQKLDEWAFYRDQFSRRFNGLRLTCTNDDCSASLR